MIESALSAIIALLIGLAYYAIKIEVRLIEIRKELQILRGIQLDENGTPYLREILYHLQQALPIKPSQIFTELDRLNFELATKHLEESKHIKKQNDA